jgi:hypothetical protein
MKIKDAEYTNDQLFDQPESGLIKQVFTEYRTVPLGISVITTVRIYYGEDDYFDSHSVELLKTHASK